jgi:hypothetical protein
MTQYETRRDKIFYRISILELDLDFDVKASSCARFLSFLCRNFKPVQLQ